MKRVTVVMAFSGEINDADVWKLVMTRKECKLPRMMIRQEIEDVEAQDALDQQTKQTLERLGKDVKQQWDVFAPYLANNEQK